MPRKIEVSHRTIIFTVIFLLALWFLYFVRDIILQLFVALLIVAILNPLVSKLSEKRFPRVLSVIVVYVLVFGVLGFAIASIVPTLADQTGKFISSLPYYLDQLSHIPFVNENLVSSILSEVGKLPGQVVKVGFSVFSNVLNLLFVFILAFYLLIARERLNDQLNVLFGEKQKARFADLVTNLELRLGSWARGQLIVMFLMGAITYVGLFIFGVPFALPLATLVGLLEIVPVFGPIIAMLPMVVVGFGVSTFTGFAVIALSFLLHQFENYVFVPNVIKKSVGVSPIITLLSLIVGFRMAGVIGAILAVPLVIVLQVVGKEFGWGK